MLQSVPRADPRAPARPAAGLYFPDWGDGIVMVVDVDGMLGPPCSWSRSQLLLLFVLVAVVEALRK